jgi:SAM-dependent methyltransferase
MIDMIAPIYDTYAPIYDTIGQARFGAYMAGQTLQRLTNRRIRVARALDLACGTGAAALVLAAAGCEVVGIDQSAAMLHIARGKARDASANIMFVQGDIRDLPTTTTPFPPFRGGIEGVYSSFDLATCFYDSLNYLTSDGDLELVFGAVAAALRPGGYLVFDLNTAAEYAAWDERDVVTYDGHDCMVYNQLNYDPATRLATGRIAWFVRETDLWWRGEETHTERAWSDTEVCGALAAAGLALLERLDTTGAEAVDGAPRVVYISQRQ